MRTIHNDPVRPLLAADIPPLATVIDATGLFPGGLLTDMAAPYLAGRGADHHWWTYDAGAPMGVAYAAPEPMTDATWNLLLIAVDPARHGVGIGRAMIARIEADLSGLGARLLLIETSSLPEFDRTRRFYRAQGYGQEAVIRDYYRAGEGKIVFAKPLR